jgi:hypothetical protein
MRYLYAYEPVCAANQSRSTMAELFFTYHLGKHGLHQLIGVASSGTYATPTLRMMRREFAKLSPDDYRHFAKVMLPEPQHQESDAAPLLEKLRDMGPEELSDAYANPQWREGIGNILADRFDRTLQLVRKHQLYALDRFPVDSGRLLDIYATMVREPRQSRPEAGRRILLPMTMRQADHLKKLYQGRILGIEGEHRIDPTHGRWDALEDFLTSPDTVVIERFDHFATGQADDLHDQIRNAEDYRQMVARIAKNCDTIVSGFCKTMGLAGASSRV